MHQITSLSHCIVKSLAATGIGWHRNILSGSTSDDDVRGKLMNTRPMTRLRAISLATIGLLALTSAAIAADGGTATSTVIPSPAEAFPAATDDGAWCWFSEPRAIGSHGRTYTGWVTRDGSIQAAELAGPGGSPTVVTLHQALEVDDHNNPAFLALPDGRLAAWYATHSHSDLFLRITDGSGDFRAWTPERTLGLGTNLAYVNPVLLSQEKNRIFLFFRGNSKNNFKPNVAISDDLCATWSQPKVMLDHVNDPSKKGANCRPYVRYWDDGKGRIDFLFTDGHPEKEPKNRVHFMRYEHGVFSRADGTRLGTLDTLPIDIATTDVIYDGSAGRGWVWDIAEDQAGNPVALYTRLPGDEPAVAGKDHRYAYARWNGKNWTSNEFATVNGWFPQTQPGKNESQIYYSPGMSLLKTDPSTVFYSDRVGERLEIIRATTPDQGVTWNRTQISATSKFNNVRPVTVRSPNASSPSVLWMNFQRYVRYTDYRSGIRLAYLPDSVAPPLADAPPIRPAEVLALARTCADWQLAKMPAKTDPRDWEISPFLIGLLELGKISGTTSYDEAVMQIGKQYNWAPVKTVYEANDHGAIVAFALLYEQTKNRDMIAPSITRFDALLANPPPYPNDLMHRAGGGAARRVWSWIDALFFSPAAWLSIYQATGDDRYLQHMNSEWWRTSAAFFDEQENLFFRDNTYIDRREKNGQKVFWARGNGWVMGGLTLVLQRLPQTYAERPRYEALFKRLATRLATLQQPDGTWHASLLDPDSTPLKETSGTAFFCYALAWGINQGLLDKTTYTPVVARAWTALAGCVTPAGKLTHVQVVASGPEFPFTANDTKPYGTGAFLLAAAEVHRLFTISKK